jgi:hypothetical protein
MWLRIAKVVAGLAIQLGLADRAKAWLKRRIEKQLEAAEKKAEVAITAAVEHGIDPYEVAGAPKDVA